MKNLTSPLITVVIALIAMVAITGCETWRDECGGKIIVENPIPDTTLYVGGKPFRRDVFESPEVFLQTENKSLSILVTSDDGGIIADANRRVNNR